MWKFTAINILILMSSTYGEKEICTKQFHQSFDVCQKRNTITRISQINDSETLHLNFHNHDTIIDSNAFNNLKITGLLISSEDHQSKYSRPLPSLLLRRQSLTNLPNLSIFGIGGMNIAFDGNPLKSLGGLRRLVLMDNELREVATNVFKSLRNLEELDLHSNLINVIHSNTFVGLKQLKYLSLRNNIINSLEIDCFSGLHELEILHLSNNKLTSLPSVFSGLLNLKELDISYNPVLKTIEPGVFMAVSNLRELKFHQCDIDVLPILDHVPRLETLDLGVNKIRSIPQTFFKNLKALRFLHLSENEIYKIETNTFAGLNLSTLDLGRNSLSQLEPFTFNDTTIDLLDFRLCHIKKINLNDFFGLTVKSLHLAFNEITEIASGAFNSTVAEEIFLYHNPIATHVIDKKAWGAPDKVLIMHDSDWH